MKNIKRELRLRTTKQILALVCILMTLVSLIALGKAQPALFGGFMIGAMVAFVLYRAVAFDLTEQQLINERAQRTRAAEVWK